jgi:hypothetical protein
MSFTLPKSIATYIDAENGNDPALLAQCFAPDAVVRDEGQKYEGLTAIQRWTEETKAKYQHTIEPLAFVEENGTSMVAMRLAGNFPGSPIEVKFVFALKGDRIASLTIHS